jgi:hypothetical protein
MSRRPDVQITHVSMPRESRITFRRHLPVWVGLVRHGTGTHRRPSGICIRLGDRSHLFESSRPYKRAREENISRLFRRVVALEKTLDAAGVTRLPVDPKRG